MKKKVNFYISKPEGLLYSKETNKFGFRCVLIGKEYYSLEEINLIKDKLLEKGVQIEITVEKALPRNNTEYIKCGKCKHFLEDYGCNSEEARVSNKNSRTKLSKGCFWGEEI